MKGKVIAVSGGANGIGAEVSSRLVSEGAHVVIADVNSTQAAANAASMAAADGRRAIGIGCDISRPEQCESLAEAAV